MLRHDRKTIVVLLLLACGGSSFYKFCTEVDCFFFRRTGHNAPGEPLLQPHDAGAALLPAPPSLLPDPNPAVQAALAAAAEMASTLRRERQQLNSMGQGDVGSATDLISGTEAAPCANSATTSRRECETAGCYYSVQQQSCFAQYVPGSEGTYAQNYQDWWVLQLAAATGWATAGNEGVFLDLCDLKRKKTISPPRKCLLAAPSNPGQYATTTEAHQRSLSRACPSLLSRLLSVHSLPPADHGCVTIRQGGAQRSVVLKHQAVGTAAALARSLRRALPGQRPDVRSAALGQWLHSAALG